jgi:hypothetical protein
MRFDQDHPQQEDGDQQDQREAEDGEDLFHRGAAPTSAVARNRGGFRTFVICSKA